MVEVHLEGPSMLQSVVEVEGGEVGMESSAKVSVV